MRSDYALYVVAVIFFVITIISLLALSSDFERNLSAVATVVLGLLFAGVGYTQRPRAKTETAHAPVTHAPVTHAPVTHAPVTHAPVTQAPVTHAPVTHAPVTQAPVTHAPVTQAPVTQVALSPPAVSGTVKEAAQQKIEPVVEPITAAVQPLKMELTAVKGIKEKRAEQLRSLGISSVEQLANASAEDLAKRLKIAPYFTQRWVENAKEIIAKS
jgi:predicted flap endonuclease-1-like 5' DNA nuclease